MCSSAMSTGIMRWICGLKRRDENNGMAQLIGFAIWTIVSSAFNTAPMRSASISCWKSGGNPLGWHWPHWEQFQKLKQSFPLVRPKLSITYAGFQAYAKL